MELPVHLIYDIFLYLPVKTLVRFRSLSKEWNRTITSPAFVKQHLTHHHNKSRADHMFINFLKDSNKKELLHYQVTTNTIEDSLPSYISLQLPQQKFPFKYFLYPRASCHGMMCFKIMDPNAAILVWNPATRQFSKFPWPPFANQHRYFIGFGYDNVLDDYKIVLSTYICRTRVSYRMHIMTLKGNNSWRTVNTFKSGLFFTESVTLDGDIYWASYFFKMGMSQGLDSMLLRFNVMDENLTILPCPPKTNCLTRKGVLGQYKGSLCIFNYDFQDVSEQWASVSTLGYDSEGKPKWNSLMDVPIFTCLEPDDICIPGGITKNGDLIIYSRFGFLIYLARENKVVKFGICGL